MAWIESHQSVGGHPKTRRAARSLGISIPTMVGHLHLLWHWALDYAQEGDLSRYEAIDIADAAQWDGEPDEFIEALVNAGPGNEPGFLERNGEYGPPDDPRTGELVIRDWWNYAGKLIAKRQADAERKRQARSADKEDTSEDTPEPVQEMSGGHPTDVAGNRNPNRTQPTKPKPTEEEPSNAPAEPSPFPEPIEYVGMWAEEVGKGELSELSPQFKSQQCGVAKQILERGYDVDVTRRYVRYLLAQDWRDQIPDLRTVLKGIDAWYAGGAPAKPKARASPKNSNPDTPFDAERNLNGPYADVFKRNMRGQEAS